MLTPRTVPTTVPTTIETGARHPRFGARPDAEHALLPYEVQWAIGAFVMRNTFSTRESFEANRNRLETRGATILYTREVR